MDAIEFNAHLKIVKGTAFIGVPFIEDSAYIYIEATNVQKLNRVKYIEATTVQN